MEKREENSCYISLRQCHRGVVLESMFYFSSESCQIHCEEMISPCIFVPSIQVACNNFLIYEDFGIIYVYLFVLKYVELCVVVLMKDGKRSVITD